MAHRAGKGSTDLGRDSRSKRLGVKRHDGQAVKAGEILVRQRGTKFIPGDNVKKGSDDTLYATIPGIVKFASKRKLKFDGSRRIAKVVEVQNQS